MLVFFIIIEKCVYILKIFENNIFYLDDDDDEFLKFWRRKDMFYWENLELFNFNFYNWIMYVILEKIKCIIVFDLLIRVYIFIIWIYWIVK